MALGMQVQVPIQPTLSMSSWSSLRSGACLRTWKRWQWPCPQLEKGGNQDKSPRGGVVRTRVWVRQPWTSRRRSILPSRRWRRRPTSSRRGRRCSRTSWPFTGSCSGALRGRTRYVRTRTSRSPGTHWSRLGPSSEASQVSKRRSAMTAPQRHWLLRQWAVRLRAGRLLRNFAKVAVVATGAPRFRTRPKAHATSMLLYTSSPPKPSRSRRLLRWSRRGSGHCRVQRRHHREVVVLRIPTDPRPRMPTPSSPPARLRLVRLGHRRGLPGPALEEFSTTQHWPQAQVS
mmetsp:Transcript_41655/g.88795  ORF Transcript_41655/g.88795 Transcript_41655/m.88795 type:complete len:287 (-) Transcript_41655:313-1173(-)